MVGGGGGGGGGAPTAKILESGGSENTISQSTIDVKIV